MLPAGRVIFALLSAWIAFQLHYWVVRSTIFFSIFKQTSEQHSVNSSCKTSLFSDAFRVTVVDFFREFY